ncbi:MAG TPA: sensor histidine kinase [Opitutaceae bacterium]|nr:sensor histidine kinase [Opitutaceae bacterium]
MRFARWFALDSTRGLRVFLQPGPRGRTGAWVLLGLIALGISVVDRFTGVELSLSILYLVPISLASAWFGWRSGLVFALITTALRLVSDFASVFPHVLPGFIWWNVGAAFAIFGFVAWLVDALATAHRRLEGRIAARTSELADSIADRRRLEMEVLEVTARERSAIGRELHDELGQHLVATALAAQVLAQKLGQEHGGADAHAIVHWIEEAIAKTRKLARGLLLARIESDRFVAELQDLAASSSQAGVRCHVSHQGAPLNVPPGECAQLFRIAQEAIGNALRHGRPQAIEITIANDAEATCLIVTDDGAGFATRARPTGMGLRIMEHRAQIIGASLAVLSTPGEGTRVICRLPAKVPASP